MTEIGFVILGDGMLLDRNWLMWVGIARGLPFRQSVAQRVDIKTHLDDGLQNFPEALLRFFSTNPTCLSALSQRHHSQHGSNGIKTH
jgi:hypothetical protein